MVYFRNAFSSAPTVEERNAAIKAQMAAAAAKQAAKDALDTIDERSKRIRCPNIKCSAAHLTSAYIAKSEGKATIQECIGLFCVKCESFYLL